MKAKREPHESQTQKINYYLFTSFFSGIFFKKRSFCYINFLISPHGLFLFKILEDDQWKRTRQARDPFPHGGGMGEMLDVRYVQSLSFPQKLVMALKNKIHTLYSTIHVYHRCLTINTVITLNLIVSNCSLNTPDCHLSRLLKINYFSFKVTGGNCEVHYINIGKARANRDQIKLHRPFFTRVWPLD